ncbi:hypothetical protein [Reinekea sp. G2M2-21]|uniref:hypothetical protein n=1 Tax=Reinekea sp. G2M2-21 TaxID=2788942 RepID=UPI0018A9BF68|nr:hypothetical protein [Reinekea sp. G2M2-21]
MTIQATPANPVIEAAPLLLKALSTQIKEAGGRGYNSDVIDVAIDRSFSVLHTFDTPEGKKTIKTRNEFQVGLIDADQNYFVIYNADRNDYRLVTVHEPANAPKVIRDVHLGYSFEVMMQNVQARWPNRVVWRLTDPNTIAQYSGNK